MSDKSVIIPLKDAIDIYIAIKADYLNRWNTEEFLLPFFPEGITENEMNKYWAYNLIKEEYRPDIEDMFRDLMIKLAEMGKYIGKEEDPLRAN